MENPYFKFYVGDWQRDSALRCCSLDARGLWVEMLCIMHQSCPYGYFLVNGKTPSDAHAGVLTGVPERTFRATVRRLLEAGVASVDSEGRIFSRRMIRDENNRKINKLNGTKGGSPLLKMSEKEQDPVNPPLKPGVKTHSHSHSHSQIYNTPNPLKKKSTRVVKDNATRFAEFWAVYPRKDTGPSKPMRIWESKKLDKVSDRIIEDVKNKEEKLWSKNSRQFTPMATTYLNLKAWEGEMISIDEKGSLDNLGDFFKNFTEN